MSWMEFITIKLCLILKESSFVHEAVYDILEKV